jgi:LPS sulfotransferase NodH
MNDYNHTIKFNNCTFTIPANKSIVVIATPRSGSNALCNVLAKKTNLPMLGEIFNVDTEANNTTRPTIDVTPRPAIIKIFPNHVIPEDQQYLLTDSFVIGLYRKDLIAQTVSYYTTTISNQFIKTTNDINTNIVTIPLNTERERNAVNAYWELLLKLTSKYNSYKKLFDIELAYEDIIADLAESDFIIQEKSTNYNVVYNYVMNLKCTI